VQLQNHAALPANKNNIAKASGVFDGFPIACGIALALEFIDFS
jgi:hypothetical protein